MKGVPEAPRCGFSNAVCQILRMHDVTFKSFDVLSDEELRSGVKEFSKWPTYPQVFFKGELIGGCDILLQMHQSGDLVISFLVLIINLIVLKMKMVIPFKVWTSVVY